MKMASCGAGLLLTLLFTFLASSLAVQFQVQSCPPSVPVVLVGEYFYSNHYYSLLYYFFIIIHLAGIPSLPICPPTNSSSDNIGYRWRYTIPGPGGFVFSEVEYSQDEVCLLHNRHLIIQSKFFENRARGSIAFSIVSTNDDIIRIEYGKQAYFC